MIHVNLFRALIAMLGQRKRKKTKRNTKSIKNTKNTNIRKEKMRRKKERLVTFFSDVKSFICVLALSNESNTSFLKLVATRWHPFLILLYLLYC